MPPINLHNINQVYLLSYFDAIKVLSSDRWMAMEVLS